MPLGGKEGKDADRVSKRVHLYHHPGDADKKIEENGNE